MGLQNEHGVAIAIKAVFLLNGFGIEFFEPLDAFFGTRREKGGDEAEQGRFWQMEISNHSVDGCKFTGRVDVDVGLSLHGA